MVDANGIANSGDPDQTAPKGERGGLVVVSDSGVSGRGFDTYLGSVVSLSKDTFTPRKVLVIPRKRWHHPDMTGKLFTGTLSLSKTKPKTAPRGAV